MARDQYETVSEREEAGTIGLSALRRLVFGYPSGTWFVLNDQLTGLTDQGKDRRWIIAEPCDCTEVATAAYVRSASASTGLRHRKHEHRDAFPLCRIDRDGRIKGETDARGRTDIPRLFPSSYLDGYAYSCDEPLEWVVREVTRMFDAWRVYRDESSESS